MIPMTSSCLHTQYMLLEAIQFSYNIAYEYQSTQIFPGVLLPHLCAFIFSLMDSFDFNLYTSYDLLDHNYLLVHLHLIFSCTSLLWLQFVDLRIYLTRGLGFSVSDGFEADSTTIPFSYSFFTLVSCKLYKLRANLICHITANMDNFYSIRCLQVLETKLHMIITDGDIPAKWKVLGWIK